jgi:DNA polymerase alpha subunit A
MTESLGADSKLNEPASEVKYNDGGLPTEQDADGNEVVRMFWWDAFEDPFKQPGTVYLFGKIKSVVKGSETSSWVSTCLIIRNIEKHVYLLPRQVNFETVGYFKNRKFIVFLV